VDEKTVVVRPNGQPGELSDLKVGQWVKVYFIVDPSDPKQERAVKIEPVAARKMTRGESPTTQLDIAKLITDLSSEDGHARVAATRAIFALDKDALEPLARAGAQQIGLGHWDILRIDIVYSLLDGLNPHGHDHAKGEFRATRFLIYAEKTCTQEDVAEMGERHGFTTDGTSPPGKNLRYWVKLKPGKKLVTVLKAILLEEPQVISAGFSAYEE
jgi:hypothetical protein